MRINELLRTEDDNDFTRSLQKENDRIQNLLKLIKTKRTLG